MDSIHKLLFLVAHGNLCWALPSRSSRRNRLHPSVRPVRPHLAGSAPGAAAPPLSPFTSSCFYKRSRRLTQTPRTRLDCQLLVCIICLTRSSKCELRRSPCAKVLLFSAGCQHLMDVRSHVPPVSCVLVGHNWGVELGTT